MDRHGLAEWLDSEADRGIVNDAAPSRQLIALVAESRHLLVSPLARAQATANTVLDRLPVTPRPEVTTLVELSEAALPVLQVPRLRLPLGAWGNLCRVSWFLGCAGSVESRQAAVARANGVT